MSATDQDLAQAFRALLDHITKLRHSHATAIAEAERLHQAGRDTTAAAQGALDALDAILESEAAVRGRRALTRAEWGR